MCMAGGAMVRLTGMLLLSLYVAVSVVHGPNRIWRKQALCARYAIPISCYKLSTNPQDMRIYCQQHLSWPKSRPSPQHP